jgi:hypothetical protein
LHTKTDAKSQVFTYSYDSYKRLTQVQVGSTVLRTFMYDTNTLNSTYSGQYTQGRLVAVQNQAFTPQGYVAGQGGSNISVPSSMQFVEMYAYTQAGLTSGKRLQVQETFKWYVNNNLQTSTDTLNMDGTVVYQFEISRLLISAMTPNAVTPEPSQITAALTLTFDPAFGGSVPRRIIILTVPV